MSDIWLIPRPKKAKKLLKIETLRYHNYQVKNKYLLTMAPHSSTLAWKIPWAEEPGRLQSMGSLRAWHDWATSLSLLTFMRWRRKWQPLQYSCLQNPRDGGAWCAAVYGIAQSRTRLKRLSSSSNNTIEFQNSKKKK